MAPLTITGLQAPRQHKNKKTKHHSTTTQFKLDSSDLDDFAIAQYVSISSDGHHIYRQTEEVAMPTPINSLSPINGAGFQDDSNCLYDNDLPGHKNDKEGPPDAVNKCRVRRYLSSVRFDLFSFKIWYLTAVRPG
jgi:hypothetical protein